MIGDNTTGDSTADHVAFPIVTYCFATRYSAYETWKNSQTMRKKWKHSGHGEWINGFITKGKT
jgi:hypothetical protein